MKKYTLTSLVFIYVFVLGLFTFNINLVRAEVICPNGNTLTSNCTSAPSGATEQLCPNGKTLASNCTSDDGTTSSSLQGVIAIGAKGDDVKTIQQFLKNDGYSLGAIDGNYGKRTARAVSDFQYDNNLTVTGKVDTTTLAKLNAIGSVGIVPLILPCNATGSNYSTMRYCPPETNSPVISGVSGPQLLDVNQQGTWTVSAYDKKGGNLSYSVVWGDEYLQAQAYTSTASPRFIQQSATFTHSYSQAGNYTPTFTVTSENTIRCITTPCPTNGGSAQTSLSVNVRGSTMIPRSLTVFSPNGGETWIKGTMQTISWNDYIDHPTCPVGATDCYITSVALRYYDIQLVSYYPPCTGNICPMYPISAPRTIAKSVYGSSYFWSVGKHLDLYGTGTSGIAPDGSYTIQICQTNTTTCDLSDNYFKITNSSVGVCEYANPPLGYHYEGMQSYPICGGYLVIDS